MAVQAKNVVTSTLLLSLLSLAGCDKPGDTPPKPSTAAAPAVPPYTPPSADQLQQMVAPIALFPDKLVGQVLAGATYPAQITAADQWVEQNRSLKGDALQATEANQPWDVSVKSLTAFPSVLDQMAGNIQWTTALGEAYANDPNDVMNAIQVMRSRAQQAGTLKSSPQLRVSTTVRAAPPATYVEPAPSETVVYAGPPVVAPPPQTIVIEPAEPDVVYVPQYNPTVVYGAPVPVYPGWAYREPAYVGSDLVTTGAITFGIGVLVGAAVSHHHDWGWHAWGVNWGGPGYGGGWHRPAVVYNNNTYVTKSVTVINRVNNYNFHGAPPPGPGAFANHVPPQQGPGGSGPHGWQPRPGPQMAQAGGAHGFAPQAGPQMVQAGGAHGFAPHAGAQVGPGAAGRPMSMPHFTQRDAVPGTRGPSAAAPAMAQHDFRQQPNVPAATGAHDGKGMPAQGIHDGRDARLAQGVHDGRGAPPAQAMLDRQRADAMRQQGEPGRDRPAMTQDHGAPPLRWTQQQQQQQQQQQRAPEPDRRLQAQQQHADQQRQAPGQPYQPPQRGDAGMQHAQAPQREQNMPDRGQAHAIRQEVLAMHPRPAERPQPQQHAQQQPQAQHAERHEQAARHDNHDRRDQHG
ncbi:hypothetical protein FHW58_001345 [Duganella sp. 1224]|uniref:DUF3300 domain-containing protein n=1 Tax=Duganella sp. 1224 TaxID=2587052 RepID=UPI0015C91620|nr:DUF3300 domain-containing protein [Duganella sp. 1224]NYE60193.1 hypothetical protein [Duganella sp. 1224]